MNLPPSATIAYTTVMSTMDNLHTKGWLARERDGKAYRYWPTLSREQHSARLMREALDGGGSPELVLHHFVEQIGVEESARLHDCRYDGWPKNEAAMTIAVWLLLYSLAMLVASPRLLRALTSSGAAPRLGVGDLVDRDRHGVEFLAGGGGDAHRRSVDR